MRISLLNKLPICNRKKGEKGGGGVIFQMICQKMSRKEVEFTNGPLIEYAD